MARRIQAKIRETPAYDETFTVNFNNLFIADRHSMTLDGNNRDINYRQFLRIAEENDVKNAAGIISEVSGAIGSFETRATENGIAPQQSTP